MNEFSALPVDADSRAALAGSGLELCLLDPRDSAAVNRWLLADARGFHDATPGADLLAAEAREVAGDRLGAVLDPSAAEPLIPVATVRSWMMGLSVPGGVTLPAWAISSVTVAQTHRRRGIARALLTAELRTAVRLGLPAAMLTVSEATIYARYGFGPAAHQAGYSIDTARARWTGPEPAGRVHFVAPESLVAEGPPIFDRARSRAGSAGEVDRRPGWWRRALGLLPTSPGAEERHLRAVRFDDDAGTPQGFALYRVVLASGGYPGRLDLVDLVAATDDAAAALWRFVIEMDLVSEIVAPLRDISEPMQWQVQDRRAVRKTQERDHLWLRILDLPAVLERRGYAAPGDVLLSVTDDLGFADGDFLLSVAADGRARAHPWSGRAPAGAAHVSLAVADVAALYLGGCGAVDLARAGRLVGHEPDAAARVDAAFHTARPPHLSIWF